MKICVAGAGAIGGLLGARMAAAGFDTALVTLGPDLDAIRSRGLTLIQRDGAVENLSNFRITDDTRSVGPQDVVVLAVKAHQIHSIAANLPALFGPETVVVTVQNGLPWWYFYRYQGALAGYRLESADPHGTIAAHIPAHRIIGCVAYPAVERVAPGVLRHVEGSRFPIGELDGSSTDRIRNVASAFAKAGFKSPILPDIRAEIWLKAIGALAFNPISALTRGTLLDICQFGATRDLAARMMREAEDIAGRLGVTLRLSIERRIAGAEAVGPHKTSMLQDVERGSSMELAAILGTVIELARRTSTPTPNLDAVYACAKLLDKVNTMDRPEPVDLGPRS